MLLTPFRELSSLTNKKRSWARRQGWSAHSSIFSQPARCPLFTCPLKGHKITAISCSMSMLGLGSVAAPVPVLSQYPSQDLGVTFMQTLDGHKVQLGVEFPQLVVVYRRCSAAFARKCGRRAGLWMDQGHRKLPEGGGRAEACGQTACWSVRLKASPRWDQSGRRMCKGPREAGPCVQPARLLRALRF